MKIRKGWLYQLVVDVFNYVAFNIGLGGIVTFLVNPLQLIKAWFLILWAKIHGRKVIVFYTGQKDAIERLNIYIYLSKRLIVDKRYFVIYLYPRSCNVVANKINYFPMRLLFPVAIGYCDAYITMALANSPLAPKLGKKIQFYHSLMPLNLSNSGPFFDEYDYFLASGKLQAGEIEEFMLARGKSITIIPFGYPKFDSIKARVVKKDIPFHEAKSKSVIILLSKYQIVFPGIGISMLDRDIELILERLTQHKLRVTLRPHPYDLTNEEIMDRLKKLVTKFDLKFSLDRNYESDYAESIAMITDISGAAYTYKLYYPEKKVFFVNDCESLKKMPTPFVNRMRVVGKLLSTEAELDQAIEAISEGGVGCLVQETDDLLYQQDSTDIILPKILGTMFFDGDASGWKTVALSE